MKRVQYVAVNDAGRRIGESHPRAQLTDHEVDLIRELIESGMSLREVAKKFEVSFSLAGQIARYEVRAQTPSELRAVEARMPRYSALHGTDPET